MKTYICRMWTKKNNDWTSDFERCNTEKEAIEAGKIHISMIKLDEQERSFEVYEQ